MELPAALAAKFPFARRTVDADGVRLSVVDDGPRGGEAAAAGGRGPSGETLLFLHGNPTWSFLWRSLLGPAKAAGHRVVAPDHAGFGLSEKPVDPAYYSLERHARNLERVAAALDVRDATLVLHDWGGPIGMTFAARNPQRVRRIVVCNTVAFPPRRERAFSRWHAFFASPAGYALGVRFDLVRRSAMRFGVRRRLPRDVATAYAWPMREHGGRVAAARFVQLVPDGPDHPSAAALREVEAAFPKLQDRPVLVLWADRDPVMPPRYAARWKAAFPSAEVEHVAPQAGHFWQEDEPGLFLARILEFVSPRAP